MPDHRGSIRRSTRAACGAGGGEICAQGAVPADVDGLAKLVLAELCRRDLVPALWVPSLSDRELRERLHRRAHLIRLRTAAKNRVFGALSQWGLRIPLRLLRVGDPMSLLKQIANKHIQVVVPPDRGGRSEPRPGWTGGRYSWMRTVLASEHGKGLYRKRIQMIEPVFAHTKHNRLISRFHRRGRAAVRTEWRLLMATHNLTKLHRHQLAITGA